MIRVDEDEIVQKNLFYKTCHKKLSKMILLNEMPYILSDEEIRNYQSFFLKNMSSQYL